MSQQFLVTVTNPDYAEEIANPAFREVLQNALIKALPYDYNVQTERYDPENQRDDLSKIQAIKRIRGALGTSLTDSKFLTDTAEKLGESKWMNVRVYCSGPQGFRVVID